MNTIPVRTTAHAQLLDITAQVQLAVAQGGLREGACLISVPHTTAGLTIQENADPNVVYDILGALDRLVPWRGPYRHAEGNAAAHVKSALLGSSHLLPVREGRLVLGTWQAIYFCEFDGPQQREVHVQLLPVTAP